MRPGFGICVAVLLAGPLWAATALGEPLGDLEEQLRAEPFTLSADSLHYDVERELYMARGHVRIEQPGRSLRADWAAFNRRTGRGVASGDVRLVSDGDVVRADFVEFDLEVAEGQVRGGRFESASSHFVASAAEITKTGPDHYHFRHGRFSTCRCPEHDCPEPWGIEVEEAELQVEGYATARNARIEVLDVPVLWLPWAAFPVKTDRQTGFLLPEFSFSSFNGFEIGLPFFWAPRDEVGLVLTPRFSTDWGFGGAAALDYAPGPDSYGELLGAYYYDEQIDPGSQDTPYGRHRWSASGRQYVEGPAGLALRSDLLFASDNDMPFDFEELEDHRNDRFLVSSASVGRAFGGLGQAGASVGAGFVDDLQNPDRLDRDPYLLQRWPEAKLDLLPSALAGVSWLAPSIDVDYAFFQARDGARGELPSAVAGPDGIFLDTGVDALPDSEEPQRRNAAPLADPHGDDFATTGGTEGDGRFQEGEPLADRGHRLLLHPRLALPLDWRGVQLVPEVGWHQTFYDSRRRGTRQRGFLTTRADLSTRLRRDFGAAVHVIEPRVGYALAWTGSQSDNTLFVPATAVPQDRLRALALDTVTRDDADRIERAHQITAGADNRVYDAEGELRADFRALALYDFERGVVDALVLDGDAFPIDRVDLRFNLDFDPHRGRVDEGLFAANGRVIQGLTLHGAYRWVREVPLFFEAFAVGDRFDDDVERFRHIDQVESGFDLDLSARWKLRYRFDYSIEGNRLLANRGALEYFSACGCWSVALEVKQDRTRGFDTGFTVRLLGLGEGMERRGPGFLDALQGLW